MLDTPVRSALEPSKQTTRLTGIDVARGLAVLGMYAVHVGPDPAKGGIGVLFKPFQGHSAALFAVLAGVSIALMSGGRKPKTGRARTEVALRLGTRAPLLIALGLWLTGLDTGYVIILAYYGVCFLFAIPWLRFGVKVLAGAAIVAATVFPLVSFAIRGQILPRSLVFLPPDLVPEDFTGSIPALTHAAVVLVFTGTFPALNLMTYVFAGMAIGRMDLGSPTLCRRLLLGGAALAVVGSLLSWVATDLLGGMQAVYRALGPEAAKAGLSPEAYFRLNSSFIHGSPPTTSLAWQLLPTESSYTPFDFVISIGAAAAVIGGCQLLMPRFERVLRPLRDLGGRVLSAYVLHLFVISLLWTKGQDEFSLLHFVEFSVVAVVAAVAWRRWIGRGPLEWVLHTACRWPGHVLPVKSPECRSG